MFVRGIGLGARRAIHTGAPFRQNNETLKKVCEQFVQFIQHERAAVQSARWEVLKYAFKFKNRVGVK